MVVVVPSARLTNHVAKRRHQLFVENRLDRPGPARPGDSREFVSPLASTDFLVAHRRRTDVV